MTLKMPNPKFDKKRPVSWSAISSFEYDPSQWHRKYVIHGKCSKELCLVNEEGRKCPLKETSVEMEFGKMVGKKFETDIFYLPELGRLSRMEYPFHVSFSNIPLIGFADSFCDKTNKKLLELKTGVKKWDQKRVDNHKQIDMYLLMNYLINKVKPEDVECRLAWLPTKKIMNKNLTTEILFVDPLIPKIFKTTRTMVDILNFGNKIKKVVSDMEKYAIAHD